MPKIIRGSGTLFFIEREVPVRYDLNKVSPAQDAPISGDVFAPANVLAGIMFSARSIGLLRRTDGSSAPIAFTHLRMGEDRVSVALLHDFS